MSEAVYLSTRAIESPEATEVFITATPEATGSLRDQARATFQSVRDLLGASKARILQERVFATKASMPEVMAVRADLYGDLDDGVAPARLAGLETLRGPLAGVQVHAVCSDVVPEPISLNGTPCCPRPCGRLFRRGDWAFLTASSLCDWRLPTPPDQARAMLDLAEAMVAKVGGDLFSIARTWMWLGGILSWYGPFNKVRNQFFTEKGLISPDHGRARLPASTGIGIGPAGKCDCAMDLVAVLGPGAEIEYLLAGGDQDSAYKYGSAFSRASRIRTPAGQTVYVSGTAAIDPKGVTEHVGDVEAQIEATIAHVRAVLKDMGCGDQDVVQAIVYCKTPEVERIYRQRYDQDLPWPRLIAVEDICRGDLLCEIEATACPGARKV